MKILAGYLMWNLKICLDSPNHRQTFLRLAYYYGITIQTLISKYVRRETITDYSFFISVSWPNWPLQIQTCLPMLNRSSSSSWPVHLCSVWMKNPGFFWPRQVLIGNSLTNLIWQLKSKMLEDLVPDQIFSLKSVMKMITRASPDKFKLSLRISRAHFQVIIFIYSHKTLIFNFKYLVHCIKQPILKLLILNFQKCFNQSNCFDRKLRKPWYIFFVMKIELRKFGI